MRVDFWAIASCSEVDYADGVGDDRQALDVANLSATRGGRRVLDRVSFAAHAGEVLAIVGPNGAGKTTLLEAIVGLVPSTSTRFTARGEVIDAFARRARTFAYMPDDARLPEEVSVRTLLAPWLHESGSAPGYGRRLGVDDLLDRRSAELSRGEAKRVWLALTLSLARPILVLDEPFGAFDPLQLDAILDVVRDCARAGATVLASVHQMSTAERIADRIVLLADGRSVANGTLAELRALAGGEMTSFEDVFRRLLSDGANRAAT